MWICKAGPGKWAAVLFICLVAMAKPSKAGLWDEMRDKRKPSRSEGEGEEIQERRVARVRGGIDEMRGMRWDKAGTLRRCSARFSGNKMTSSRTGTAKPEGKCRGFGRVTANCRRLKLVIVGVKTRQSRSLSRKIRKICFSALWLFRRSFLRYGTRTTRRRRRAEDWQIGSIATTAHEENVLLTMFPVNIISERRSHLMVLMSSDN